MKIYTSYYGQFKRLIKNNILPISVSLFNPKYLKKDIKVSLKYLAPRYKMLKMTEEQYIPEYVKLLQNINPKRVIEDLEQASQGKDVALMCYEIPSDFCHRHMIADWLNKKTKFEITEWSETIEKNIVDKKADNQVPLF
tara:strand:+ start:161 stop:577 length:417 start_codon:yes stop_codon:yes gene_type:complete